MNDMRQIFLNDSEGGKIATAFTLRFVLVDQYGNPAPREAVKKFFSERTDSELKNLLETSIEHGDYETASVFQEILNERKANV